MRRIYLDEAWALETGSSNVRVAVLDTGLVQHEDLYLSGTPGNVNRDLAEKCN